MTKVEPMGAGKVALVKVAVKLVGMVLAAVSNPAVETVSSLVISDNK